MELTTESVPSRTSQEGSAANRRPAKPAAILVVDDSMFLRKRVRQALQPAGYTLVEAENGQGALDALDRQEFACVVTDLLMPGLDGFALLAQIQGRNLTVPVVVLSADIQKSTRERCLALGARAVVQKPVNPDELRSVLAGLLSGDR